MQDSELKTSLIMFKYNVSSYNYIGFTTYKLLQVSEQFRGGDLLQSGGVVLEAVH